jgi:decaprenyl-phosphate phosphoribosyltransferase
MSTEANSSLEPTARRSFVPAAIAAMRPKQWLKNVLVFAAPLAAGSLFEPDVLWPSIGAFVAFCLMSSATYLLNDVRDVEGDRIHPTKRHRAIAAGELSVSAALALAVVLAVVAMALALLINIGLAGVLLAYAVFTTSYSLFLKHEPVIELALLAMGFLLRAIAGGVASDLPISQWFLIVAGFGSLFMAAGKRYSELMQVSADPDDGKTTRRSLAGYTPTYLRFVWATSAAVTITAYCLWAFEVSAAPSTMPWGAWSVLPFVLAILRYAVDVDGGRAEAPEDVVLRDRVLLVLGAIWLVLFGLGALGV